MAGRPETGYRPNEGGWALFIEGFGSILRAGGEFSFCCLCSIPYGTTITPFIYRRFEKTYRTLILAETWLDLQAYKVKLLAWVRGLFTVGMGLEGARRAAAGLA